MFVWSIPAVCEQLDKHCPELASFVEHVAESPAPQETIREEFPTLTPVSIDFALMEHADRVLNMEATFDWDDVGSWISVANYLETHNKNTTNTDITVQDASGNIVFSQKGDKHVALLGVENLIVVETADAILIADKNKADEIKEKSSTSCQTNSDDQSAPALGIDYGEARIGIAATDPVGIMAHPVETIHRHQTDGISRIVQLVQKRGIRTLVLGLPSAWTARKGPPQPRCVHSAGNWPQPFQAFP